MLTPWKKRFPKSFDAHSAFMLDAEEHQSNLMILLTQLDERQLLDESMMDGLLKLHDSFKGYLPALHELLLETINRSILSLDILVLLGNNSDPVSCMNFMIRAHDAHADAALIHSFLSHQTIVNGLSRAMTLFDLSCFEYSSQAFEQWRTIATVLANPLCQTIFDARLRGFSDYTACSEPIDPMFADGLITRLHAEQNKEKRIELFFNACATLRPFPPTQKYMKPIDVSLIVEVTLTSYCQKMIQSIACQEDEDNVRDMIKALQTTGGKLAIFESIKYQVAHVIESEDLYSSRTYQQLMDEIGHALSQPQMYITPLPSEWQQSKAYCQITPELKGKFTLFSPPSESLNDEQEMTASKKRPLNS
jgi:hypothetical protein